jgi:hypothetical protein
VLGDLIERIGLEDAGELVAFATTEQLAAVFDEDLWRSDRPGEDERFDADRFLLWLEVMLEAGDRFVAQKLFELPTDLVTLAFQRHLLVLDMDALIADMQSGGDDVDQIEKALSDCLSEELEEYRLIARRHEGWDDLLTAILALDRDHHDYLMKILDRCAAMSSEYIEDNGGLYEVLTSEEMLESDVAADREDRRAEAGHVAPSSAAAFLKLARRPIEDVNDRDPLTRAYFRSLSRAEVSPAPPARAREGGALPRQDLLLLLRDADVIDRAPAGLLGGGSSDAATQHAEPAIVVALRRLAEKGDDGAFASRSEELAYVANVLASGCSFQGRKLRPVEAVRAAIATSSLGLEIAAEDAADPADVLATHTADGLFRLAWHRLHEDVVRRAGEAGARWVAERATTSGDSKELERVAARLKKMTDEGTPWRAAADVESALGHVDPEIAELICGLIDECPTMRGALREPTTDPSKSADDHRFVSTLADLARIHEQLERLKNKPPSARARGAAGAKSRRRSPRAQQRSRRRRPTAPSSS